MDDATKAALAQAANLCWVNGYQDEARKIAEHAGHDLEALLNGNADPAPVKAGRKK